ncbi:tRNA 2-thiouridine(34) synthase MnmA [Flavobacteriaceae bacterium]|nr:tRNA 2-thiouridine(34) synthase MnmA [Flavobacteriaceae bacterium]MDC1216663.1 tRNA 2-thiouridine(34) synthase MnmA [Flavobacteriaceae bacterium]
MNKGRVIVGLSGGVDSSVAAHLLKEEGYEVIGLFMKNWHDESVTLSNECPWLEDSNDAMLVAEKLGIPFQTVDLSKEYKERIVDYMFDEYSKGRTPNPDILCNREIKFDVFLEIALSLGADYVATGHYCQKKRFTSPTGTFFHQLKAGADKNKDQSYFLCQLTQKQLSKVLFPIGHLQKEQVRKIALKQDLVTAEKKDSQGLCFIGKVRLPDFLQQQLKPKAGTIIEIPNNFSVYSKSEIHQDDLVNRSKKLRYQPTDGVEVGKHNGAHFYTIGQRKGLGVGGNVEPLFIIDTNVDDNTIYVGQGKTHPGLFRYALKVAQEDIHWVREDLKLNPGETLSVHARIRYRQALQQATLFQTNDALYVSFENPQSAITSGQFVAWYQKQELIGSGVIT